jgi:CBS domain-containing protein
VSDVACKMRDYKVRRIPVIENEKLFGVITNIDMVKVVIKHKKELLDMALGF